MKIAYYGQMKEESRFNTRQAEITYNVEKEENIVYRMMDLMQKTTVWKKYDGFVCDDVGSVTIEMKDKDEYDEFVEWYKGAKKMFKNCAKYGF